MPRCAVFIESRNALESHLRAVGKPASNPVTFFQSSKILRILFFLNQMFKFCPLFLAFFGLAVSENQRSVNAMRLGTVPFIPVHQNHDSAFSDVPAAFKLLPSDSTEIYQLIDRKKRFFFIFSVTTETFFSNFVCCCCCCIPSTPNRSERVRQIGKSGMNSPSRHWIGPGLILT